MARPFELSEFGIWKKFYLTTGLVYVEFVGCNLNVLAVAVFVIGLQERFTPLL
jgi:hypothetical protein